MSRKKDARHRKCGMVEAPPLVPWSGPLRGLSGRVQTNPFRGGEPCFPFAGVLRTSKFQLLVTLSVLLSQHHHLPRPDLHDGLYSYSRHGNWLQSALCSKPLLCSCPAPCFAIPTTRLLMNSPASPRPSTLHKKKMEDRKRALSTTEDLAPPSKRIAVNGSKAKDDAQELKEEGWIEVSCKLSFP